MENKKTFWYHRVTGDGLTVNIYNIHSFCATFDKKDFAPPPLHPNLDSIQNLQIFLRDLIRAGRLHFATL